MKQLRLLILGAEQYGRVVKAVAEAVGCYETISFLDDRSPVAIGKLTEHHDFRDSFTHAFVASNASVPEDTKVLRGTVFERNRMGNKMYQKFGKRFVDIVLSLCGIIVLTPLWIILAMAIKIDDPGPVFFKQKRIAQDLNGEKQYFQIYKYRSMKMCTPKDTPTHLLENPEQYITKVGGFLRKTSLDELPQIFNIFAGTMSIIGPRPALWNQDDLYAERAKYGANAVKPGLTGWAQINGRDELPIDVKARLDGEYVEKLSFSFDVKCFFGTIVSVLKHDGVVEGGTGTLEKEIEEAGKK